MRDFDIIQATEHRIQACGPSTGHTVKNVAMCDSAALADFLLRGVEAMSSLSAKDEELAKLREENEWKPISSCPFREPVDLWCVYGGEEFAQFEGGASIGRLISNRIKTVEYGFFGNQSNDGVPQANAPDLVPVAWRRAVPSCPATLIAEALGIPLTLEGALAKEPTP